MPSRNVLKVDVANSYYHVYARGASKQPIFLDSSDFDYFVGLFARYLSPKPVVGKLGIIYPNYRTKLELLAYCLMNNHFHLLIYQVGEGGMSAFMRSLMTSYSRYFNLKYGRTGSLFESRYRASKIGIGTYLEHISRYIHLNPRYWKKYPYSSAKYYSQGNEPEWLKADRILHLFASRSEYTKFLEDYEDHKHMLDEIKHELANR